MILLPIKPKYAFSIEKDIKKVEFRKINFKNRTSDICIVYASSPYQKIIWYFKIKNIIEENTFNLWEKYKKSWWIEKEELNKYYFWKNKAYVILIDKFYPIKKHVSPKELINDFKIPQSFKYLTENEKKAFFYDLI